MRTFLTLAVLRILPLGLFVGGWQILVAVRPKYSFFLGSPAGILKELSPLLHSGNLLRDAGVTMIEALLGFISGGLLGTLFGLTMWGSERPYLISRPYLVALGSVPVFALGPVLIFWFGTGIWSKVALGFLSTFIIAVAQSYAGAAEADPNLVKLVLAFGGSRRDVFFKIIAPSATIWVLAGVRLNIGMALLAAFVGEFISSRMGLGHFIIVAEGLYNINQVWVGCLSIVVIAISLHSLTMPIEKWAKRWQ